MFKVKGFRRFLPADPEAGRKHDLVQIYADKGGLRTIAVKDIVLID